MLTVATTPPEIDIPNESAFVMRVSGDWLESVTTTTAVEVSQIDLPESFLAGLADYEAGRIVDMERALEDEPPPGV